MKIFSQRMSELVNERSAPATLGLLITTRTTVKEKETQIKKLILHIDLLAEFRPSEIRSWCSWECSTNTVVVT